MEKISTLKTLLLAYTANIKLFESTQYSFDCNLALYRRRKKRNLMVLHHLRKRQIFLLGLLQQNATQRSLWKLDRQSQFWEIIYNSSDDGYFKNHLRMTRASFDILCSLLGNLKRTDTTWRRAIPLPKRIAIALFALGSSGEYRVVSELFGVGKSTVCTILLEFCKEVWSAMSTQYIKKLPPTHETLTEYVEGFSRHGFPQCLGAIGGCHIEVKPNPKEANDYCNNKGWYSIVLLALVDYRYRFLYVNIGAPGSCDDSQIFNTSLLKQLLTQNEVLTTNKKYICGVEMPICILGDSAFRFSTFLMKPYAFSTALTESQKLFNYKLSKSRRVVEKAFGHLKARFQRIGKGIDNRIGNASIIIRACCILHNFLNERNDVINESWLERLQEMDRHRQNPTDSLIVGDNDPSAEIIRQALCHYFCGSQPDVLGSSFNGDEGVGSGVSNGDANDDRGEDNGLLGDGGG